MKYSVHFINSDIRAEAAEGALLSDVMTAAGLRIDMPCGGHGLCGKCLVRVRRAGQAEFETVRACKETISANIEVDIPEKSEDLKIMLDGSDEKRAADPFVRRYELKVRPCGKGESASDWDRFKEALSAAGAGETWQSAPKTASGLGALLKKTGGTVWAVCCEDRVLEISEEAPEVYMAAIDLGTTSIAGFLLDAVTGETLASCGKLNPQTAYGADVIARADYALREGTNALSDSAREGINIVVDRLCAEAKVSKERIFAFSLAGNTCMHHLFLDISPASLACAPYNPAISEPMLLNAADCGLIAHPKAQLYVLPVIAGFVGGDTVGCLVSGDWMTRTEKTLMIDIGTNGEMVMGNRDRMIACSTAAGPAFEGAKISCGMRGTHGAIDHVYLKDGKVSWHVNGDRAPEGLCGSGLLDLAAVLLKTGAIDDSGYLDDGAYTLEGTQVTLTQKDVREIQLAKAAIAAGVRLLAKRLGWKLEEIETVEIAGAFGNYMDADSACAIGLIPGELAGKVHGVGNAAGAGAKRVLLDRRDTQAAAALAKKAEFLELATLNEFQDVFVDELEFPEVG